VVRLRPVGAESARRATALAIFAIVVAIALAFFAAVGAPTSAIVASGGITLAIVLLLYFPVVRGLYWDLTEEYQRRQLRKQQGLI
jgi:hypothetical protein